jgi:hypothetical protein
MTRSTLSPASLKIARTLRNAKRATLAHDARTICEPMRYDNDSIEDTLCYDFSSNLSYENDSGFERDFSIGLDC